MGSGYRLLRSFLLIFAAALSFAQTTPSERLEIVFYTPRTVFAGSGTFTLNVSGTGFKNGASVVWNGTPLKTIYYGSGSSSSGYLHVSAEVDGSYVARTGTARVSVKNPDGLATPEVTVAITTAPTSLSIITTSPNTWIASSTAATVTVTGTGFVQGCKVLLDDLPLATTFLHETKLTAIIPATYSQYGTHKIYVVLPSGEKSNGVNFGWARWAGMYSASPTSVKAGSGDFTLSIAGDNYEQGDTVYWDITPLVTTLVSKKDLLADVPAALIASPGSAQVRVKPLFGMTSGAYTISITETGSDRPTLSYMTPTLIYGDGSMATLNLVGSNFTPASVVMWDSTPLQTTFISSARLAATASPDLTLVTGNKRITIVNEGGITSNAFTLAVVTPRPRFTAEGVVNAANGEHSLAPGCLFSIYGKFLQRPILSAMNLPLPKELSLISVKINGIEAPLLFVSPDQINGQIPFGIQPGKAQIVIRSEGLTSDPVEVDIGPTAPGIFASDNGVLVLDSLKWTIVSPDSPARPGQYLTAYMTGQGEVDNPVESGDPAPVDGRLSRPLAPARILVGGVPAEVLFVGLAPGFAGISQVNFVVPDGPLGGVPIEISVGSKTSPPAVLPIQPAETKAP